MPAGTPLQCCGRAGSSTYTEKKSGDTVKNPGRIHPWRTATLASAVALSCTASWAARDFTPQAGTWVVSEELDGKPGRGLAIDVQGNTFFMQVFGYEKNGDATFYTATGQMDGNGVVAPLMRWRGGRSFGSEARDAVEDSSLGMVSVSFRNGLQGTVQFPGEAPAAIERMLVTSAHPDVTNPLAPVGSRNLQLLALTEDGNVAWHWRASISSGEPGLLNLSLGMDRSGESFQTLECRPDSRSITLDCKPAATTAGTSEVAGSPVKVDGLRLQLAGRDVSGSVQLGGDPPRQLPLAGFTDAADLLDRNASPTTWRQQNYDTIMQRTGCHDCSTWQYLLTLMPSNGTWIVEDEMTGKPGRGIALDVQGSTAVVQLFNYKADGQPTFHMGSASYEPKGANTYATAADLPMDEYAGGRSLGGVARSAQLRAHAGTARLEIALPPPGPDRQRWNTVGTVQLPGEAPLRIRRLLLDVPAGFSQSMLGSWYLPGVQKTIHMTRIEGDRVMNADGSVVCLPVTDRPDVDAGCGQPLGNAWVWFQHLRMPVPDHHSGGMIRLTDRFGNSPGLGNTLLD